MRSFISSEAHACTPALGGVLVSRAAMMPAVELQSCEEFAAPTITTESVCDARPHLIKKFVLEVHGAAIPTVATREVEHCPGCPAHEAGEVVAPMINQMSAQPFEIPADFTWNGVASSAQPVQIVMDRMPAQANYAVIESVPQVAVANGFDQSSTAVVERPSQPDFSVDRFVASILGRAPEYQAAPAQVAPIIYSGVEQPSFRAQLTPQVAKAVVNVPVSAFTQWTTPHVDVVQQFSTQNTHQNVMDRLRMLLGNGNYRADGSVETRPATFREYIEADFTSPNLIEERDYIIANLTALKSQFIRDIQPSVKNLPDVAALVNDETFYQWMLGAQITPAVKQTINAVAQLNQNAILTQVADKFMTRIRDDVTATEVIANDADGVMSEDEDYEYDDEFVAEDYLYSDDDEFNGEADNELPNAWSAEFESRLLSDSPTI